MTEVSFLYGELIFTGIWIVLRILVWIQQKKIDWKREAALLLMFINLAVIIRLVYFPFFMVEGHVQPLIVNLRATSPYRINLTPFVHIVDYSSRKELLINILGNMCMFIPTGILLPILYKKLDRFWKVVLVGLSMSLMIELSQLLWCPTNVTDIDDLMLNTLGAAIGYGIYYLCRPRRKRS